MPLTAHQKMEDDFLFSFLFLLSFGFGAHLGRTIWYHIVGWHWQATFLLHCIEIKGKWICRVLLVYGGIVLLDGYLWQNKPWWVVLEDKVRPNWIKGSVYGFFFFGQSLISNWIEERISFALIRVYIYKSRAII